MERVTASQGGGDVLQIEGSFRSLPEKSILEVARYDFHVFSFWCGLVAGARDGADSRKFPEGFPKVIFQNPR